MSTFRVTGLLDRPNPKSLGMLGIVVEREHRRFFVDGVVGMAGKSIDGNEFKELQESGDAQLAEGPDVEADTRPQAALWVGSEFAEIASRHGVTLPPLDKSIGKLGERGTYWVGPTQHVWRVLDSWVVRASQRSIVENNAELAALMAWALPGHEETRAAIWSTNARDRQANLDWWARLDRDHGAVKVTSRAFEDKYRKLANEIRSRKFSKVVAFCALAKGGDNEIAKELSLRSKVKRLSFGQWLTKRANAMGKQPDRPVLQDLGQSLIEAHGALWFCLEVLSDLPTGVSTSAARFVIDGIRHDGICRSLESLIGEQRLHLVEIERSESERRSLLIGESGVLAKGLDEVMNHATEREVPLVAKRAAKTYRQNQGVVAIAELERVLATQ